MSEYDIFSRSQHVYAPGTQRNAEDTAMTGKPEFVDVLVIGAGLAGIGSACQFRRKMPQLKLAILEARQVSGGTWDLFRYPGIRSDSDMYTYSYGFKPWTAKSAIADGETILKYIRETAEEYGLNQHIRYNHKVVSAHWSSQDLSLIHISEPTRPEPISYAVFCLKK